MSDGMPRIIARQNSMYIVTPKGAVWQVFDADTREGMGSIPRNDQDVLARIFVGTDEGSTVRIYRFGLGEARSVTAWRMLEQLERALLGDDRAA
jgi:hypothetical protein